MLNCGRNITSIDMTWLQIKNNYKLKYVIEIGGLTRRHFELSACPVPSYNRSASLLNEQKFKGMWDIGLEKKAIHLAACSPRCDSAAVGPCVAPDAV